MPGLSHDESPGRDNQKEDREQRLDEREPILSCSETRLAMLVPFDHLSSPTKRKDEIRLVFFPRNRGMWKSRSEGQRKARGPSGLPPHRVRSLRPASTPVENTKTMAAPRPRSVPNGRGVSRRILPRSNSGPATNTPAAAARAIAPSVPTGPRNAPIISSNLMSPSPTASMPRNLNQRARNKKSNPAPSRAPVNEVTRSRSARGPASARPSAAPGSVRTSGSTIRSQSVSAETSSRLPKLKREATIKGSPAPKEKTRRSPVKISTSG